ncbi:hypothetical protein J8L86_05940 [Shewanella sp. MMG014]|uniref:hypothetical protein n=1 Tax=Shewanella sp. MMG014 TaxID=2822691 RepID=UPI001B388282|nr:hypothetical protein [Shewanella sp. MMG014]MBQ4889380.1 hypothetical protein [Shewanella sp. MMG014]
MKITLSILLLIMSANSFATDVKLGNLQRYGTSPHLELFLMPSGGSSIAEVFEVITYREREFTVRLIGQSSELTNQELLTFYQTHYPIELEAAFKSSGNLHNPAINGVRDKFPEALKSTTIFKQLLIELNKLGYEVTNIEFEKFTAYKKHGISIPDVYIKVVKSTKQDEVN